MLRRDSFFRQGGRKECRVILPPAGWRCLLEQEGYFKSRSCKNQVSVYNPPMDKESLVKFLEIHNIDKAATIALILFALAYSASSPTRHPASIPTAEAGVVPTNTPEPRLFTHEEVFADSDALHPTVAKFSFTDLVKEWGDESTSSSKRKIYFIIDKDVELGEDVGKVGESIIRNEYMLVRKFPGRIKDGRVADYSYAITLSGRKNNTEKLAPVLEGGVFHTTLKLHVTTTVLQDGRKKIAIEFENIKLNP